MVDNGGSEIYTEKRDGVWYVIWLRPGYPPRMMMSNLALIEAQRAEDGGELSFSVKMRKAAAEARDKNQID